MAVLACPGPVYMALGVGVEYLLAWALLGQRPVPMQHDPKTLSMVSEILHSFNAYGTFFSPVVTVSAVALAIACGVYSDRWERWGVVLGLALCAWPVAMVIFWLYPAILWEWWWD